MHRRRFIQGSALLGAGALVPAAPAAGGPPGIRTISWQPEYYHGWPTVARRANGDLWLAWSGGREGHVCPFGQVCAMVSHDEGTSWTWPRVLLDSPIDDRDCGVVETARGTLLVSTFSSLAYQPELEKARRQSVWPADRLRRWNAAHDRLSAAEREAQPGHGVLRSTDHGTTWSALVPTPVNSPHGPVGLKSGRLLYAGKRLWAPGKAIGIAASDDDGLTWQMLAELAARPGDTVESGYHELHAVEAADGSLIVHVRNHNPAHRDETLQCESRDGGKTWTELHPIGVWGLPSHLLLLRDGRLLMTYGHRRPPFGNLARTSGDHGKTWSSPITISADGNSGDLGYPSTVQLGDGSLLTVWYEQLSASPNAVLRQARWRC